MDSDHDTYGDRKFAITVDNTPIALLAFSINGDTITQTIEPEYDARHALETLINNAVLAWEEEQNEGPMAYVAVRIPVKDFMLDLIWAKKSPHATWIFHKATEEDKRLTAKLRKPPSQFNPISFAI